VSGARRVPDHVPLDHRFALHRRTVLLGS
jgi:hypothetical protein